MDDKVIQAGKYNAKSTEQETTEYLRKALAAGEEYYPILVDFLQLLRGNFARSVCRPLHGTIAQSDTVSSGLWHPKTSQAETHFEEPSGEGEDGAEESELASAHHLNKMYVNEFSLKFAHSPPIFSRELWQIALSPLGRGFAEIWHRPLRG